MKVNKLLMTALAAFAVVGVGVRATSPTYAATTTAQTGAVNPVVVARCEEAMNAVNLNFDKADVRSNLILPAKGLYKANISWVSSNPSVLKIEAVESDSGSIQYYRGIVTRGDANVDVILSGTAQIGNEEESVFKIDYPLTISKKDQTQEIEVPDNFLENFNEYKTGIDLSNYYKWRSSNSEAQITEVVEKDQFPNINNMPSTKVLKVYSSKIASPIRYTRKINLASKAYTLEGDIMYNGDTNGVGLELVSGSNVINAFSISTNGFAEYQSKEYKSIEGLKPTEGVWYRFRLEIKFGASSKTYGSSQLYIYDHNSNKYVEISEELRGVLPSVTSGNTSSTIDGFRISALAGSATTGETYLANLKLAPQSEFPAIDSESFGNFNRNLGIGLVTNYDPVILANKEDEESITGVDPKDFKVYNRFDLNSEIPETSYDVITYKTVSDDGRTIVYRHTYTLKGTGEKKIIEQKVVLDDKDNITNIENFKVSYLKNDPTDTSKGTVDITGNVIRRDGTLHYVILTKGSPTPSASSIVGGSDITGMVDHGELVLNSKDGAFHLTSGKLDYSKEYDVYAVVNNPNGLSPVYSALEVSTVVNIATCQDFFDMATNVDTAKSTFRLLNDIDFSSFYWNFEGGVDFKGVLDGQGFSVKNLNISTTVAKVGIFNEFQGVVRNIIFDNCSIAGLEDVGLLASTMYGGSVENAIFNKCSVIQEETTTGGAGYFGILCGRYRGEDKTYNVKNVSIEDAYVKCSKYCGLLTGGIDKASSSLNIEGIYASGNVNTEGAAVGLIGRNRCNTTINNGVVYLTIDNAKKEIGVVAGHNKEGGKLKVSNFFGDLKIKQMTQITYFGNFIGSNDPATSTYEVHNVNFLEEDYSDLADSIDHNVNAVHLEGGPAIPEEFTAEFYEKNTFIRDFTTSLWWKYDEATQKPVLSLREASDISVTADQFEAYVDEMDEIKILDNHYNLYKAQNVYNHLSDSEKAKIDSGKMEKYTNIKNAYERYQQMLETFIVVAK